jgi:CspA family cold shock protein
MASGKVIKFDPAKGSGQIQADDGGDLLFVHRDYLRDRSATLAVGLRVEFEVARAYRGRRAKDVVVVDATRTCSANPEGKASPSKGQTRRRQARNA